MLKRQFKRQLSLAGQSSVPGELSGHSKLIGPKQKPFLDGLFERGYLTYVIDQLHSQNVFRSNPKIKPKD